MILAAMAVAHMLFSRMRSEPPAHAAIREELSVAAFARREWSRAARSLSRLDDQRGRLGPYAPMGTDLVQLVLKHWDRCETVDRQGIPVIHYDACPVDDVPRKAFVNPGSVAQFALRIWDLGIHTHPWYTRMFLAEAAWLLHHQESDGAIPVEFPIPMLGLKPGWTSAMYQGLAISLFLRAYQTTHDRAYLHAASMAVRSFTLPYGQGGTVAETVYGPWPQEYAGPAPPSVLNGGLSALIGLEEYHIFTGRPVKILNTCLRTLDGLLPALNEPGWAKYQLAGNDLADGFYMPVQSQELLVLGRYAKDPTLIRWSSLWTSDFMGRGSMDAARKRAAAGVLPRL